MSRVAPRRVTTRNGLLVGILKGSVLYKRTLASKHLYRKVGSHGSWGIDYDVLFKQLPERGAVHINEQENHVLYTVKNAKWRENGEILHFKEGTTDHYTQVFLPLEYFDKVRGFGA